MLMRRKNTGIGLLELLLSLVVIAALLLLVTRYYLITERAERVSKAAQMINNIVDAAVKYSEGLTNTKLGINMDQLVQTRLLSENYSRSPWSRSQDDVMINGINNGFILVINSVPAKECKNLQQMITRDHPNIEQKCTDSGKYSVYSLTYHLDND